MTDSNYFGPADFKELWQRYVDDYANIQDETDKEVKEMIIEDLEDKGFSKEEINALVKFEESSCDIGAIPPVTIWTKFCAYALLLVNDYNTYNDMCDIIDEELDKKVKRYEMPTKAGDGRAQVEILDKIFKWSLKIDF